MTYRVAPLLKRHNIRHKLVTNWSTLCNFNRLYSYYWQEVKHFVEYLLVWLSLKKAIKLQIRCNMLTFITAL